MLVGHSFGGYNVRVFDAEQARASGNIADTRLIVLTAGRDDDRNLIEGLTAEDFRQYQEVWVNDLQMRQARLSVRGKRVVIFDSGHDMSAERPDAIVSAVRQLL